MEVQLLFLKNPKHCSVHGGDRIFLQKEPVLAMAACSPELSCLPTCPRPPSSSGRELLVNRDPFWFLFLDSSVLCRGDNGPGRPPGQLWGRGRLGSQNGSGNSPCEIIGTMDMESGVSYPLLFRKRVVVGFMAAG